MRRRLAEMQKRFEASTPEKKTKTPRDILVERLGYRGLEVLELAERQYPVQTRLITKKMAELILHGEINQEIGGGDLLALFRAVGFPVRIETRINVEKDGKLVSLSDKLKLEED